MCFFSGYVRSVSGWSLVTREDVILSQWWIQTRGIPRVLWNPPLLVNIIQNLQCQLAITTVYTHM